MKLQLSALDIFLLVKELKKLLPARVQKIYDLNESGIELILYSFNEKDEKKVRLIPPVSFYLSNESNLPSSHLEHPSSFVMSLRKHLINGALIEIEQNHLDRILELVIEKKDEKISLILEFFSKGNIFLCDNEKRILGLQKWQKWKDRTLGVGQEYKYPPSLPNPLTLTFSDFKKILQNSSKSLAAVLVRDLNLGKTYSEELCLSSKIEKGRNCHDLTSDEHERIFTSLQKLLKKFKDSEIKPVIVLKEKIPFDFIPFELEIYSGEEWKKKKFSSFHQTINEYFSSEEKRDSKIKIETYFQEEIKKLMEIKENQINIISDLKEKEVKFRKAGNIIYQNLPAMEKILKLAQKTDKAELPGKEVAKVKIKDIRGNSLLVEV